MEGERPDLAGTPPQVVAYIEQLEQELARLRRPAPRESAGEPASLEPSEPPTTVNVVTVTRHGMVKRTPRHLYARQRRGGMGVFGLDTEDDDPPAWLLLADETTRDGPFACP